MNGYSFWLVIALAGAGTFTLRSVPFFAHGVVKAPPVVGRLLKYVPAASLAALVIPGSVLVSKGGSYGFETARLLALAVAVAVAVRWRNVVLTLVVGMVALWMVRAALPL